MKPALKGTTLGVAEALLGPRLQLFTKGRPDSRNPRARWWASPIFSYVSPPPRPAGGSTPSFKPYKVCEVQSSSDPFWSEVEDRFWPFLSNSMVSANGFWSGTGDGFLRLVFTSDGVIVGVVIRSVEWYELVKIKPTESEAEHWIRLRLRGLRASENCIVGVANGRIHQSQCSIPGLVIGFFCFCFRLRQPGRNGSVVILPTPIFDFD